MKSVLSKSLVDQLLGFGFICGCLAACNPGGSGTPDLPESAKQFNITVSGDSNESFSPNSTQVVSEGAQQTFSLTADLGYVLSPNVGGSCPYGAWQGTNYTTAAIHSDCSVVFSAVVHPFLISQNIPPLKLTHMNDLSYSTSLLWQVFRSGNLLLLTGNSFGFGDLDISSSDQPGAFNSATISEGGFGALTAVGSFAYTTGIEGMSVIDLTYSQHPIEANHYTGPDFIYTAIAAHPTLPLLYGFSSTSVYTLATSGSAVHILTRTPYTSSGDSRSISGAAYFNGQVFAAEESSLWILPTEAGQLSYLTTVSSDRAVNFATSDHYLYVQLDGSKASMPSGIYVRDDMGKPVAFLPAYPDKFAVSADDRSLFAITDSKTMSISSYQLPNH